jgi:hypothetical protein
VGPRSAIFKTGDDGESIGEVQQDEVGVSEGVPGLPDPRVRGPATQDRQAPSVNTKIRLITRIAFGFKSPDALIALAMLNLGGHRPALPGRN